MSTRHISRPLAWLGIVFVMMLGLVLAGILRQARATAAEPTPQLPNLVADPPNNVSLETSTTEGGLKASGEPKLLLRFNGYIHNIGPGALDVRGSRSKASEPMKAFQRVYNSGGSSYKEEPSPATLEYATADGHEHWHLQHAARYSLWNSAKTAEVSPAMKVGFCLDDSEHVEPAVGPGTAVYSEATGREFCKRHQPETLTLFEGISAGWRDLYDSGLAFQWVDATNVLPGEYWLREDVNPDGVIKETGGANTPSYAASSTIIPGFDALAHSTSTPGGQAKALTLTSQAWKDAATPKYKIISQPGHGTLSAINGSQLTYTPAPGYTGPDSFTYSASDPNSPFPTHPSIATFAIEVGEAGSQPTGELLLGDETTTYPVSNQTTSGREETFQFTAKSTGTVEELEIRTNTTVNTGVTGVILGVFAENAGQPGAALGSATVSGQPATSSWIKASGLSIPVQSGTKYWLGVLPQGSSSSELHYSTAVASGGTGNLESTATGLTALTAESVWETFNQGPVGFQAIGSTPMVEPSPTVTIEGAPASITAGTSVQLSADVSNDSPTVTWSASAGSITSGGLYTAPSTPGSATIAATSSRGAKDQRTISIVPVAPVEAAPSAPPEAPTGSAGVRGVKSTGAAPDVSRPRAMLIRRKLIMTTLATAAGRVRLSAWLGRRFLGSCSSLTPAHHSFTCRLTLAAGVSAHSRIRVVATLRTSSGVHSSVRPAGLIPLMKMPTTPPTGHDALTAMAALQLACGPSMARLTDSHLPPTRIPQVPAAI